ncbi:MAG TPA: hypothetical protein VJP88_05160, partial [Caulobacteraceae bacterium]|nr:hypothetical protein [Caulobacteraceae bacterium]
MAIAISFVPFLGWLFVVAWFVTFIVLVDVVGPRIERPPTAAQSRRRWARRATVYVGAKHMLLGAVPFAAGLVGGLWGLVGGAFLLLCIVSLATSIARRSTAAYYAAILPLATY